ncbi:hypothetical protein V6M85_00655 [Sulfolobus tengchongensis]|uniref:Uncharacterized protein n=1 Tax=Sulfolobus tengchongensis TaxID=207809 RepID=A0AAX4L1M0_9CREN
MNRSKLDNLHWLGLDEALNYGFSEAETLGKNFIGITLDNGDGLILYVNPYLNEIYRILLMSKSKYNLTSIGVFSNFSGDKYFIYDVKDTSELINIFGQNVKVIYVEVIKDVLEDFLYQAMDR